MKGFGIFFSSIFDIVKNVAERGGHFDTKIRNLDKNYLFSLSIF
jgi:hypothetical protein